MNQEKAKITTVEYLAVDKACKAVLSYPTGRKREKSFITLVSSVSLIWFLGHRLSNMF